ncbi:cytochrome c biogenesis protein [Tuwongella immobilis]|uniref:Cytochrome c assembly protein domain-containing protein n=1 Tax=Tuwongella immobilis TaxID=692036 RepID=A0A6C2YSX4_9BACT|nr:cytochrome c biogenesis protein CcsA [Tuwongella immobilis]VIP04556.1 cytochrome c biogenesis protein : ABC-type transport system involved in cytochrome c biogenesis, permease component OS=Rubidibacter lacunae KORDI 51-2 GN=KR51_00028580 PE=4 SV=1: Cytochrom_C_asm [Tuwongella immobilis]VTS06473.1 cytochrome c biogenesis protein : ABC-type transport system involved in cytochrome c biogenesis, permease component OS=Rubidibacter lacunae KORDI 51-2 GN=KR51_00028580 PE=4 SV=1: Cytochrom_C_asm [Tuwo
MASLNCCSGLRRFLLAGIVVFGVGILGLGAYVLQPYFSGSRGAEQPAVATVSVPKYDYAPWHRWAVQVDGRTKPFETACQETLRSITGRSKFEGNDPVAVVLMWMLTQGMGDGKEFPDWETTPFILADHHGLRDWIYAHTKDASDKPLAAADYTDDTVAERAELLSEEQRHGKFISPQDLRNSPGFERLLDDARALRSEDPEKAQHSMTPEQRKAEEVAQRLMLYDNISRNPLVKKGLRAPRDPIHLVQLDRVPGSAWLSIGDIQAIERDPSVWQGMLGQRMVQSPQLYLSQEKQASLDAFQTAMEQKKGLDAIDELERDNKERIETAVREFSKANNLPPEKQEEGRKLLLAQQAETLDALRKRVRIADEERYDRHDDKYRMIHLDYLEAKYPDLYIDAMTWQAFPKERAERVTQSWDNLRKAYTTQDAEKFTAASNALFATIQAVSDESLIEGWKTRPVVAIQDAAKTYEAAIAQATTPEAKSEARAAFFDAITTAGEHPQRYPGSSVIDLELSFNKLQPFMWAWILMLPATVAFTASYISGSRFLYAAGFGMFFVSLGLQVYGFYARVAISGRAPVSNMYETVIFVAFMSALFAMILELVYRKGVIAIAGSLVATIALVLADQTPLTLDPKISPLVPVLRSNFWLIIHVLTIVASYAGGTLAWGLANVSLMLLVFGKPEKDTLKTLSTFIYRAMQIAVLLLAAGTFLGGWWAAYSWGRFWGWDPKETWALISLICYVIPLHARYIGWVKDFGLAISAVICYAAILMCWYGVNFVLGAGLHSYGFGGGGPYAVLFAGLLNIQWVLIASYLYLGKKERLAAESASPTLAANEPTTTQPA